MELKSSYICRNGQNTPKSARVTNNPRSETFLAGKWAGTSRAESARHSRKCPLTWGYQVPKPSSPGCRSPDNPFARAPVQSLLNCRASLLVSRQHRHSLGDAPFTTRRGSLDCSITFPFIEQRQFHEKQRAPRTSCGGTGHSANSVQRELRSPNRHIIVLRNGVYDHIGTRCTQRPREHCRHDKYRDERCSLPRRTEDRCVRDDGAQGPDHRGKSRVLFRSDRRPRRRRTRCPVGAHGARRAR